MKVCKNGLHKYPKEHKFCKECKSISNRKWAELNVERKFDNYKKHYSKNKERINLSSREYYSSNKKVIKEQQKVYNELNKVHLAKKSKEWTIKNKYNLTIDELDLLYKKHNYCCAICGQLESASNKKLHIDHNHTTGKVRGLLCGPCNRAIGLLKDDPNLCSKAEQYLLKEEV